MDKHRYPAGRNVIGWAKTGSIGRGEIEVPFSGEPLVVAWCGHRLDDGSSSASYFGEQYIGIFERGGKGFKVTESYTYKSITNSGRTVTKFRRTSRDGVCCTEIVAALLGGRRLTFIPTGGGNTGQYQLKVTGRRDFTFHEVDIEEVSCLAVFDLEGFKGSLQRSYYRDVST